MCKNSQVFAVQLGCRDPTVPVVDACTKEDLCPTGTLPENRAPGLSRRMPVCPLVPLMAFWDVAVLSFPRERGARLKKSFLLSAQDAP